MSGFDNHMLGVGDHGDFRLSEGAPENEDHRGLSGVEHFDDVVSEDFPALAAVRSRLPSPDRQHRVEQQYTFLRPIHETAVIGNRAAQIVVKLLVNVSQRRWNGYVGLNGKTEPVGLVRSVVRVLPDDAHLGVCKSRVVEGVKNVVGVGINPPSFVFVNQKLAQILVIILRKFVLQRFFPIVLEENTHDNLLRLINDIT